MGSACSAVDAGQERCTATIVWLHSKVVSPTLETICIDRWVWHDWNIDLCPVKQKLNNKLRNH